MALAYFGQLARLRTFLLAFFICTLATIAVSALIPAEGTWTTYGVSAADHAAIMPAVRDLPMPFLHALRDGSLRTLTATGAEGIITFPSLHAALGVIFLIALWRVPVIRYVGLGVNVLMIAATPVEGSHYFIDVFAGIAAAALSWAVAHRIAQWALRTNAAPVLSPKTLESPSAAAARD
jgi:membrane-associated phospholipid phosphatase